MFSTFRVISTHVKARMWRVSERREGEKGREEEQKEGKDKGELEMGEKRSCNH